MVVCLMSIIILSIMVLDIKICNNKQPQLSVIVVFIHVLVLYKHQSGYHMIWKDLVQICHMCLIPSHLGFPAWPHNSILIHRSYS